MGGHLIVLLLLGILPVLLWTNGETAAGRWVGFGLTLLVMSTITLWGYLFAHTKHWALLSCGIFLLGAGSALTKAYLLTPATPDDQGAFREHYGDDSHYHRRSLARLVPEIDQLALGTYLFGIIDPFMDPAQARSARTMVSETYRELRKDPDFARASNALGMAYDDLFLAQRSSYHFYEYRPEKEGDSVLIFLHGSLGNFKGYLWALKEAADALGMTILAPTYGMGNWQNDPTCERVGQMIAHCQQNASLQGKHFLLGGISNGGRGCLRALHAHPDTFEGLVLISPVIEDHLLTPTAPALNLPVLILHGGKDRRIPANAIEQSAHRWARLGAPIDIHWWDNDDHFAMFRRRHHLKEVIVPWIATITSKLPGSRP